MKRFISILLLAGCFLTAFAEDYNWCGIGNSFTFRNMLYETVEYMIEHDGSGETARVQTELFAGSALEEHWLYDMDMLDIRRIFRNTSSFTRQNDYTSMLENGPWDWFVLQHYPSISDDPSPLRLRLESTRRWVEKAATIDPDIELMLYATSVRKASSLSGCLDEMQQVNDLNEKLADDLGLILVPCGEAWVRVLEANPEYWTNSFLHAEDNFHPDDAGTYLNACVFYAVMTGRSPVGLPWDFEIIAENESEVGSANYNVELDSSSALYLQQKAWETYTNFYGP